MGFNLYGLALSVVIIGIFAFGYSSFISSMGTEYNIIISTDSVVQNNFLNQTASLAKQNQDIVDEGEVDSQAQDLAILKDTVTAARQMKQSGTYLSVMIGNTNDFFSLHPVVITALKTMGILAIVAGLLFLFFKVRI